MATPKEAVVICAPLNVAAGLTRATAVFGAAVPITQKGGEWGFAIKNGSSAPGVGCTILLQTSHDGVTWYDYHTITGDALSLGGLARSVWMSPGVIYARVGGYGNTTNAVEISSVLQGLTG